jgi:hypothetical protein
VEVVQNVPNDMGWGVFWWYPEARPTLGLNVWEDGRYGLFDQNGNLLPAATVFEQFLAPAALGDFNYDGYVDAADYVVWRKADGTPEGFDTWRTHFGQTTGSGSMSNVTVPEPVAVSLLALVAAFGCGRTTAIRLARSKTRWP